MEAGAPRFNCLWLLAILFSRQGRFADARKQLAEAVNNADQPMSKPVETSLLYAEAKLDLKEGNWEEAVSKEQTLIDRFRHIGNRWVVARNLINLGDALLGRDAPGDREQAQEAYQQSLEMFTEMGAPGYIQVLEERLGRMLK
jgi:tetratricopeptide (TPR) repeat protein